MKSDNLSVSTIITRRIGSLITWGITLFGFLSIISLVFFAVNMRANLLADKTSLARILIHKVETESSVLYLQRELNDFMNFESRWTLLPFHIRILKDEKVVAQSGKRSFLSETNAFKIESMTSPNQYTVELSVNYGPFSALATGVLFIFIASWFYFFLFIKKEALLVMEVFGIEFSELLKVLIGSFTGENISEMLTSLTGKERSSKEIADLSTGTEKAILHIDSLKKTIRDLSYAQALVTVTKQVAHDIRSPLSALSLATGSLKDLPEERRLLIKNAVQRINDIANDLLQKGKAVSSQNFSKHSNVDESTKVSVEFIPDLVDILVSEKRMQFREQGGIEISVDLKNSFGVFSMVNGGELKRVVSNLVNNAVEAFDSNQGKIIVGVKKSQSNIEIFVKDNGKGIPEHVLKKLGDLGVTHGKEGSASGSGLGVYHAKKTIEAFGGEFKIESAIGQGTTMRLTLPVAETPKWFAEKIDLTGKTTVVSFDDDVSIHQIWTERLQSLGLSDQIEHLKIQSGDLFSRYVHSNLNNLGQTLFLVDFELLNQQKTGLELIEDLAIAKHAVLVTSRYEEKSIQERAEKIGLKILPKSLGGFVPIFSQNESVVGSELIDSEPQETKKFFDIIFLDDDSLNHSTWKMAAEIQGKSILCFDNSRELFQCLTHLELGCSFYVDVSLGNGERGEDVAKDLFDRGFKNLYLATGYESDQFGHVTWIKGVVGKDFPV